jgi:hypothetical protein
MRATGATGITGGPTLDAYDHQELDRILAELAPQFSAQAPTTRPA